MCQIKKRIWHRTPPHYQIFIFSDSCTQICTCIWWRNKIPCTQVHGFDEEKKFHVRVHGFEEKTKFHLPKYMNLRKNLIMRWGGDVRFFIWQISLIFNLKILSIQFCYVSRCHLKVFFIRISKQVLLFEICSFKNCKIEFEVVNI